MQRRVPRFLAPLVLALCTAGAAAWWVVDVVVVPASIRRSLRDDLGPFFPGGMRFASAVRAGPSLYRVRGFEAFAPGLHAPWLMAGRVELEVDPVSGALVRIALASPDLFLEPGPAFLPAGAFRVPEGTRTLPRVEVTGGTIAGPLPGGGGIKTPWARAVELVFDGGAGYNTRGAFEAPLGAFSLVGEIAPGGRSRLRAKVEGLDLAGMRGVLGAAGPLALRGEGSGAFTFAFGGDAGPVLGGSLSMEAVELEGAGVRFEGGRLMVRGGGGEGGWVPHLQWIAARAKWDAWVFEGVEVLMDPGSGRAARGSATLWGGRLEAVGSMLGGFRAAGTLNQADLALAPPGLFGADRPPSGILDLEFALGDGVLRGDFDARDASLWSVPFLQGIPRLVPGLGDTREGFRSVKGRFEHAGERTRFHALDLEGRGFRLSLSEPGRVGPGGRLDLIFDLKLQTEGDENPGLAPLRRWLDTLGRELWKPFSRFIQFRIRVSGTLQRPLHRLEPPRIFGH